MKNKKSVKKIKNQKKENFKDSKNKKSKIKIIFPFFSCLIFLSGLLALCFTFKNHLYYDYLWNKFKIEKNSLETEIINNQYLSLLVDLNQDLNLYEKQIVLTQNKSFSDYLNSYLLYLSSDKKDYQNFTNFFISTYLNNNTNINFNDSMLDDYSSLKRYSYLNFQTENNKNSIYPNNAGFISGIFLISFGIVSFLVWLTVILKLNFKKRKKKTIK